MAGRGYVKVCRSRSVAVVSKMPKRTWQVNYRCISKESCGTVLREVRGELPENGPIHSGFHGENLVASLVVLSCARLQSSAIIGGNSRLASSLGTKASTKANACVGTSLPESNMTDKSGLTAAMCRCDAVLLDYNLEQTFTHTLPPGLFPSLRGRFLHVQY
jgi:hypothetical protein